MTNELKALMPCQKCNGTGERDIEAVARENIFGLADKMAARMGARFTANEWGRRRLKDEIDRLRAQTKEQPNDG